MKKPLPLLVLIVLGAGGFAVWFCPGRCATKAWTGFEIAEISSGESTGITAGVS